MLSGKKQNGWTEQQEKKITQRRNQPKMSGLCRRKNTEKLAIKERSSVELNKSWQISNLEKACQSEGGV